MPELTVSMPAFNRAKYIGPAIASVLAQTDVDFELIVVDDASQDNTVDIVRSFDDSRIRLITNEKNHGVGYCHNLVIEQSQAPFLAHVDSDDLVLPGAFRKMIDALKQSPRVGQVHCHFFDIDEDGRTTRDAFRKNRKHRLDSIKPGMDYKRELLIHGTVTSGLRTYRRDVFDVVGKLNEKARYGEDFELALRIADVYDIALVPEFLYCRRTHGSQTSEPLPLMGAVWWWQRLRLIRGLWKGKRVSFFNQASYHPYRLMLVGLAYVLQAPRALQRFKWQWSSITNRVRRFAKSPGSSPLLNRPYQWVVDRFGWWPLEIRRANQERSTDGARRIGYYLWQFPVLSQTFVQREVRALREAGVHLEVFADSFEDSLLDENARSLLHTTHYVLPQEKRQLVRYQRRFFRRHGLGYLNLFLYVVFHRYGGYKSLEEDGFVFNAAVYLAGVLQDHQITHLHSPWADRCAFISLIASRLAGIPYSVQARAGDIHRKTSQYALREKFRHAEFVVTNSHYNESHLQPFLLGRTHRLHVIRDMLALDQFQPRVRRVDAAQPLRILSVARLIEEKGLVYLLRACRILRDRGYAFQCEIVGGPEEPSYASYWVELMKLHRELALDCVAFPGAMDFACVLEKYANADMFVLPCVMARNGGRDITPNSLIEAMAMKLPVISTTLTAIPEIVEHNVSGILVPPNDTDALAQAMADLIEDGARRRELGENARRRAEEIADMNKNVTQYVDLFLGQHLGPGP